MKNKIAVLVLIALFSFGCAHNTKVMVKNYDSWMKQANELAEVLCAHSEFSVCFWKTALGPDASKLPAEAMDILEQIEQIIKGKSAKELTDCEKASILALWLRFSGLVGTETIKTVTPYLVKFIGI